MSELEKKNESKKDHRVPEFFRRRKEKRPLNNLARIKLVGRESFLKFSFSYQCLSKLQHFGNLLE